MNVDAPLDVGQLIDRDALGRRRLLDDLLVDEHVPEGVGDQLADLGSAGTENPRDADHPPRHRRTVRRGARAVNASGCLVAVRGEHPPTSRRAHWRA